MHIKKEEKVRILVFPCGTEIGLEIHRSLAWSTHVELFGASSVSSNHGKYVYKNYIDNVPFVDDLDFISKLNSIIESNRINFIFPAHDSVVLKLSEHQDNLQCKVIGSPLETCRICRSKRKTYQVFKSILTVPKVYNKNDADIQFPVFLKPDVGQGSKGTFIANSKVEIDFFLQKDPTLILMEYIPGTEYTIDAFSDRHGELRFVGPRKRIRINNGISVNTIPVRDDKFTQMAEKIHQTLKFRGAWFFQAKEKANGDLSLLEVAPRVAGSMGVHRNMGINLPLLSVFDSLDMDVEIYSNKHFIEMDRALTSRFKTDLDYKCVYIDLDDTIIIDNEVNVWVTAFLYQCHNRGVKVHLLSRHAGDIKKTLNKYRLNDIFDTVTNLDRSQEKADFIREPSSIFIDDSFDERQRVAKQLGIPTFDVNSVESLIDYRG